MGLDATKIAKQNRKAARQASNTFGKELPDEIKAFITYALARFVAPTDISKELLEKFGLEVDTVRIQYYDPTTTAGGSHPPAERWIELFNKVRKAYLTDLSRIRLSNKVERVQELADLFENIKTKAKAAIEPEDVVRFSKEAREVLSQIGEETAGTMPLDGERPGGPVSSLPEFIVRALTTQGKIAEAAVDRGLAGRDTKRIGPVGDASVSEAAEGGEVGSPEAPPSGKKVARVRSRS